MPLVSFSGEIIQPMGRITLPVTLGAEGRSRTEMLTFLVVGAHSVHNVILGRPSMCAFGMVASSIHGAIKFPTEDGIATVHTEQMQIVAEIRQASSSQAAPVTQELSEKWSINPCFPEQKVVEATKRF